MLAERPAPERAPSEGPTPEPTTPEVENEPIDVVVLVAPDGGTLSDDFVAAIARMKARGAAAVLVVFPRPVDVEVVHRAEAAGASNCVIAPSSSELFGHIERTRALRRHEADDDPLDVYWRSRSRARRR